MTAADPPPTLLEIAIYAPLGLAVELSEKVGARLRRERQAWINRIQLSRALAEMSGAGAGLGSGGARAAAGAPVEESSRLARPGGDGGGDAGADGVTLPIEDYDNLAASHVVGRLSTLRPDELEQVRRYESAHRGRRTILGKIEQIAGA